MAQYLDSVGLEALSNCIVPTGLTGTVTLSKTSYGSSSAAEPIFQQKPLDWTVGFIFVSSFTRPNDSATKLRIGPGSTVNSTSFFNWTPPTASFYIYIFRINSKLFFYALPSTSSATSFTQIGYYSGYDSYADQDLCIGIYSTANPSFKCSLTFQAFFS